MDSSKFGRKAFVAGLALGLFATFVPSRAYALASSFEDEEEAEVADEAEEPADEWLVVHGADVHTGTGAVLRGASILAKNGKIEEIGYDIEPPEDAEVVDASGFRVYPGLVAISSFGLFGGSSDLENTVDPFSPNMTLALAGGITCAVQGNEGAKLKRGEIEGVVAQPSVFTTLTFSTRSPKSKRDLRQNFADAANWLREYRQWQEDVKRDKELKEPRKPSGANAAISVLDGSTIARFSADDRTDLLGIARLAQEYGFRPVIDGCAEGWTVADELGRAGAMAIITPRDRNAKAEQLVRDGGSSIENAAKLHAAGVPVAIIPASKGIDLGGIVGRDLMHLTTEAGFAVRGGLSEEAALAGITIVPARMMRLDHRIGTIEEGKDCDLIIVDGDLLHYETFVQWAVVDGKVVYDKQQELYFAHIRPRPESALAPIEKVDAGEEGAIDPDADGDNADDEGDGDDD